MSKVHQVDLLEQFDQRNRELAACYAVSFALSEFLPLDELLAFALAEVLKATTGDAGLVSLVDPETGRLTLSAHQGLPETLCERFQSSGLEGTLCQFVFEERCHLSIGDLSDSAPVDVSGLLAAGLCAYLGAPLMAKGTMLGTIGVFHRHAHPVSDADCDLMRAIGGQLAVAIESVRFSDRMPQQPGDLAMIQETMSELTAMLSFDEAVCALLPRVKEIVPADWVSMFLIQGEQMTCVGTYPTDAGQGIETGKTVSLADYPLTRQVVETQQPLALRTDDPRLQDHARDALQAAGVTAHVTIPLVGREGVLGTLTLSRTQSGQAFAEHEVSVLRTLTDQATIALEKVRLFEQSQRRTVQLRAAARVARAASSILDLDQLVEESVNLIRDHFELYYVGLFLLDTDAKFAILRAGTGEAVRLMLESGHKLKIGDESMIGWCVAHGQPRVALNVGQEAMRFENPLLLETRSEMALPLIARGEVVGALTVQSTEGGAFSDEDITALQTMADQLANAIANAQQFELIERVRAETDKRVRELGCLNQIGRKLQQSLHVEELFSWVAERVPAAMQYPSDCVVAIECGGETYGVPAAKTLPCQVVQSLDIGGEVAGRMYVAYTEDHDFLDEESALLGDIARRVGRAIEFAQLHEETERRSERLAQTLTVSEWLHHGLELDQVLEQIVQGAVALGFCRAVINICQPEGGLVRAQAVAGMEGPERELLLGASYSWSDFQALMQEQFRISRSYLIRQGEIDWETDFEGPVVTSSMEYRGPGYWHPDDMLLVPLWGTEGRPVGLLSVDEPLDSRLPDLSTIQTLETFASQAAIAIENARLFEQTQTVLAETEALYHAGRAINAATTAEEIGQALVEYGCTHAVDAVRILWLEYDGSRPTGVRFGHAWRRDRPARPAGVVLSLEDYPLSDYMDPDQIIMVADVLADERADEATRQLLGEQLGLRAFAMIPLAHRGRWFGYLFVGRETPGLFADQDIRNYRTLAVQAAVQLENRLLFEKTERQLAELEMIQRTVSELTMALNFDEAIDTLLPQVAGAVRADSVSMFLIEAQKMIRVGVHSTVEEDDLQIGQSYSLADYPLTKQVVETRQPLALRADDPRLQDRAREAFKAAGVTANATIQLVGREGVLGTLAVSLHQPGRVFDEHEVNVLQTLADQATIAFEKLRLLEEIQQRVQELTLLFDASQALTSAFLRPGEVGRVVAHYLMGLGSLEFSLSLIDSQRDALKTVIDLVVDGDGTVREEDFEEEYRLSDYPTTTRVMETLQPLVVQASDPEADAAELAYMRKQGVATLVIVPLVAKGQAIGVMEVEAWEERRYTPQQLNLMMTLANQAAVALENARLFDEAQQASLLMSERVRELDCLNDIGRKMDEAPSIPELLRWVADRVAVAMQHPEVCVAAIEFEKHVYGTAEALDIPCQIVQTLRVGGEHVGHIYVAYTEERDFFDEESALLGDVARRLGGYVENRRLFQETRVALGETEAQARRLALLNEMSEQLNRASNLGEILDIGAVKVGQIFASDRASVALLTAEGDSFEVFALHGHEGSTPQGARVQAEGSEMEIAVQEKRLVLVADDRRDNLGDIRSFMVAPLLAGREAIGTLNVASKKPNAYTQRDGDLLLQIASLLSSTIDNRRLFEETRRRAEELTVLNELSQALAARLDVDQVLEATYQGVSRLMDTTNFFIGLYDAEKGEVTFPLSFSDLEVDKESTAIPADQGLPGYIIRHRTSVLIGEDVSGWQERMGVEPVREIAVSWLGVPLQIGDQVLGVMAVQSYTTPYAYDERDQEVLTAVASQTAIAIQNARLFEQTRAALQEVQALHQRQVRESWQEYMDARKRTAQPAYIYDTAEVRPVADLSEIDQFWAHGGQLESGESAMDEEDERTIAVPIRLRGQPIGALAIERRLDDPSWTSEDMALVDAVSEQLALALDNARAYEQLQKTAEQLREMDILKSQFLANMSHELRTPLNSIIGFSRVMLKGIDGPLTDVQKDDLTSIYNNGRHLLGLINDILDVSRIEAGKMELVFEPVDLQPIIDGVMSTAIGLVKDRPVRLIKEVPPELPIVRADSTRIRQVILNLVSNAAKFTKAGNITVQAWADDESVTVSVSDTGPGIPKEHWETIFQEFQQVDGSATRSVGGTGLGLPISRHFVEMHGGHIWVESEIDVGSTFSFTIPIHGPGYVEDPELAALEIDSKKQLVLAVESDEGMIDFYRRYLGRHGYQIVGLDDADRVQLWVRELSPFAVLMDVMMAQAYGWTVLENLKTSRETAHVPIIVCSIGADEARALSLGAAAYLPRPVLEEDLLEAMSLAAKLQSI
jgi:GAF domain-containing protein/ActR/RegA family two-component response regulator